MILGNLVVCSRIWKRNHNELNLVPVQLQDIVLCQGMARRQTESDGTALDRRCQNHTGYSRMA